MPFCTLLQCPLILENGLESPKEKSLSSILHYMKIIFQTKEHNWLQPPIDLYGVLFLNRFWLNHFWREFQLHKYVSEWTYFRNTGESTVSTIYIFQIYTLSLLHLNAKITFLHSKMQITTLGMLWKSIQKFICKRKQEESSQVYTFRKVFMRIKKESILKITLSFLLGLLKIAIWIKRHIVYLLAHYFSPVNFIFPPPPHT